MNAHNVNFTDTSMRNKLYAVNTVNFDDIDRLIEEKQRNKSSSYTDMLKEFDTSGEKKKTKEEAYKELLDFENNKLQQPSINSSDWAPISLSSSKFSITPVASYNGFMVEKESFDTNDNELARDMLNKIDTRGLTKEQLKNLNERINESVQSKSKKNQEKHKKYINSMKHIFKDSQ